VFNDDQAWIYAWAYWAQARDPMTLGGPLHGLDHAILVGVELSNLLKIKM